MNALTLVIGVLACWRVTSLISRERGLFGIGTRFRALFGVDHDGYGVPLSDGYGGVLLSSVSRFAIVDAGAHEIAEGMTCFWCCSLWVALIGALIGYSGDLAVIILYALAMSAGAILLDEWKGRS